MKRLAALLFLLRALPCLAQQGVTSELTGRVASAGQALPGVTVTLTSDSLQRSRITVTGENGGYLLALLPPADYLLRFDLEGFTPVQKRVQVSLAATTRVDVDLGAAPLKETVTVESDNARVAANASIATNFRAAELQQLPGGRDIRSAVLLSPNASAQGPSNRLVIAGAPSWDNLFLVDGVVVNEYLSGQPHSLFIEDAIQEIAALTGAISAEYGRFTGGVVSTLTKSGGNEFRGSLRDTMTNGGWTKRTPWTGQPDPLDKVNHAVEGTLGGFLLKDQLWFFAAGRRARASLGSFTALTNIGYRVDSLDDRWDVKVTQHVTAGSSLVASYIDTSLADTNAIDPDRGGRVADLASLIPRRRQSARLLALTYEGVFAANTFAEIHGSRKRYDLLGNGGGSADRVLGTVIVVRGLGVNLNAPVGCGVCGPDQRDSSTWAAKGSRYQNTRWGNHASVVGAEWFHEQRINSGSRSASEFNIQETTPAQQVGMSLFPVFDGATGINWTNPIAGSRGTDQNTWSAYLNDRWDLGSRLAVNLGVRYDRNNVRDAVGRLVSNDDAYSPRLGGTFDLRNDGVHRLIASYGRYTAKILAGGGDPQQVGVFSELSWRYHGPDINAPGTPIDQLLTAPEALARLFAWFDANGGVQNRPYLGFFTDPRYTSEFRGTLKSPVVDERTLGYAMQLQRGFLRADYIARDWHHFYAARVDTTTGQTIGPIANRPLDVAWVINDDSGTVRTYRAVQLQGSWHYRRVTAGGGYTWSTLRGNDDEDEGTTNGPRNLPLRLWYPEFLGYPQRRPIGYLAQDQRHRARSWVGYEAGLSRGSLSTFLLQRFDSGQPYSAVANIDPTRTVPSGIPANFGYTLNQVHMGPYFFSKRGAFRTDDVFSTDLAVNYEVPYRGLRLIFKGDVLNLFNNAAVVSPDTVVFTGFGSSAPGLRPFNPFTEVPMEGVNYRLSPTFGKATGPDSYQASRTFQLSFRARF